jgi:hypothetical protein
MESENESSINGVVDTVDHKEKTDDLAERKARLLRQGEFYRVSIVHAKAHVKQGARPEALFHRALDHATWALRSRVDGLLRPTGVNVASLMPYAVSILGFLSRRRLLKPALGVGVALAAASWYLQRHRQQAMQ